MLRFIFVLLLFSQVAISGQFSIQLGNTNVIIKTIDKGPGKFFIHLHQNETTSLKAAKKLVGLRGGKVVSLVHNGGRNIVFRLKGKRYEFDPNRIFTKQGIKRTLSQFSHYSKGAYQQIKQLADAIVIRIPHGKVIAIHNNKSYSLKSYLKGSALEQDAEEVYLNPNKFYRNFYLVTQQSDFNRLKKLGFNVVLQSKRATDDGSLSVMLAHQHYINVEAGYGQFKEQLQMLENA
jgi:hypothetical protein